jgi:tRNA(Ile)-lysidine synthase
VALDTLRKIGAARAKNALRYYLHECGVTLPNARRLDECVRQALTTHADTRMVTELGKHELRCFARRLYVVAKQAPLPHEFSQVWAGQLRWPLPVLGGTLIFRRCRDTGISLARLKTHTVTVRLRSGGEVFRPDPNRPRRSLKNLLQEAGVPPWQRDRLPLLYCGKSLVFVPGIGIDTELLAANGEPGLKPVWVIAD